jgi:hypothetical protein
MIVCEVTARAGKWLYDALIAPHPWLDGSNDVSTTENSVKEDYNSSFRQ